jgi:O-antigen ligase
MKPQIAVNTKSSVSRRERFDAVIEWLLAALLGFMPLAFGAVEPWSEMVAFALAAGMSACLGLKHLFGRGSALRFVWTWTYLPLALLLVEAVFQIVPLPSAWVPFLSPGTAGVRTTLLSDLSADFSRATTTISLYPYATKHDLQLLLLAASVFAVVVNVYRHTRQITRLLAVIAIIGLFCAAVALLQTLTGTTHIYWTIASADNRLARAGSFVNHSHYAQFMNLSLGAALALLLARLASSRRMQRSSTFARKLKALAEPGVAWLMLAVVLGVVTVFTSLSRNGVFALVAAGAGTSLLLARKQRLRWRGWLLGVLLVLVLASLLLVGFDAVYERLASVQSFASDARWQMIAGTVDTWRHFPVWGTGWGTHAFVFPMFDTATSRSIAAHADNDYAQLLEETGIVGVMLLAAFLIGVWWNYGQLVRRGQSRLSLAAFGLGFGLFAVMVQSLTDFGQRLPANFCLTAVICGLLVSLARRESLIRGAAGTRPSTAAVGLRRHAPVAIMLVVLPGTICAWGWVLWQGNAARLAAGYWNNAHGLALQLQDDSWQGSDSEFIELIRNTITAAEYEPDNVKHRYWSNVYRWYSISRAVNPETGHVTLHPESFRFVARIADELAKARLLCPTFGPLYTLEGQLRLFFLDEPRGSDLIHKGCQLSASYDPQAGLIDGFLAVQRGDLDTAIARFRRMIELDGSLFYEIIPIFAAIKRPELLRVLAEDDPRLLLMVVHTLAPQEAYRELLVAMEADAVALLTERCQSPHAAAGDFAALAHIHRRKRDFATAVKMYRAALAINYHRVDWRLSLAYCLAELGERTAAAHEARICLRLRPNLQSAVDLIKNLSVPHHE